MFVCGYFICMVFCVCFRGGNDVEMCCGRLWVGRMKIMNSLGKEFREEFKGNDIWCEIFSYILCGVVIILYF